MHITIPFSEKKSIEICLEGHTKHQYPMIVSFIFSFLFLIYLQLICIMSNKEKQNVCFQFYFLNIYLVLAASGLSCGTWDLSLPHRLFVAACSLLSSCGTWALERVGSVIVARRLQSSWALQLQHTSSLVVVVGLVAMRHVGTQLPTQGQNLHPLHWKADSQPLDHQGSPPKCLFLRRKQISLFTP